MDNFIVSLISFLVMILVLVFFHELGHFGMARLCGVKVEVFAVGFGKTILSKLDRYGTKWEVKMLLFGGYVKMFGDAGPASNADAPRIAAMTEEEKKISFAHKSLLQKALIVFAGPLMNYLLAFVLMFSILFFYGGKSISNQVFQVEELSPAAEAGLAPGDIISKVNGQTVHNMFEIKEILNKNREGYEVSIVIKRNELEKTISLRPKKVILPDNSSTYMIGVSAKEIAVQYSFVEAIVNGAKQVYFLNLLMVEGLFKLISGHGSKEDLGGPIKIAQIAGQAMKSGVQSFLSIMSLLSLNLALMNLLPVPGLDGGHLMYYAFNAIAGKPIPQKLQETGIKIGLLLLIFLLLFVTYNDIFSLFK